MAYVCVHVCVWLSQSSRRSDWIWGVSRWSALRVCLRYKLSMCCAVLVTYPRIISVALHNNGGFSVGCFLWEPVQLLLHANETWMAFFFFLTLYTVLSFVCQSYWIEFALLPDLMSLFFVFDEWLGSWTITLRSLSLFVLYVHRAKSLQYIRAVPWKKVFMLPFRLTRVLFGFRCIPDALLWNDSAFLARSSLRREYILSDA